jgi:hypothetical protein
VGNATIPPVPRELGQLYRVGNKLAYLILQVCIR